MSRERRKYWLVLVAAVAVLAFLVAYLCCKTEPQKNDPKKAGVESKADKISNLERMRVKTQLGALMRALAKTARKRVRVSGTVRELGTDEPVGAAEVIFTGPGGETVSTADSQGRYTMALFPGAYRAFAKASGYVAVGWSALEDVEEERDDQMIGTPRLDLAPLVSISGDQEGIDIQLRGAGRIKGRVVDGSGWPVVDAVIAARPAGRYAARLRTVAGYDTSKSDGDGAFELDVPAGPLTLSARHEEFAGISSDSRAKLYISPGETKNVDLTLAQGCIISGHVIDLDGEPVGHGAIEMGTHRAPPYDFEPVAMFADGEFTFSRTEPGPVRLRAWPWKSPPAEAQDFVCEEGAHFTGVTFVIPNSAADLEGSLVTSDGEPVVGARIYVFPLEPGGMAQREQTDVDGNWAVFAQPAGRYLVSAHVPGDGVAFKEVYVPSRDNVLTLGGTGSVSGTIADLENGSFKFLPTSCLVEVDNAAFPVPLGIETSRDIRLVAVTDGRFTIDDLPACLLQGYATHGLFDQNVEVEIRPGDTATIEIEKPPPPEIMEDWF